MEIIITENQKQSTQDKIKNLVKKLGWNQASDVVGGVKNLTKLGFDNDPMEFLNIFNNLDVVQSEEEENCTLFRYETTKNVFIYDREVNEIYVSDNIIWDVLERGFGVSYYDVISLIKVWLRKVFGLKEYIKNVEEFSHIPDWLTEIN